MRTSPSILWLYLKDLHGSSWTCAGFHTFRSRLVNTLQKRAAPLHVPFLADALVIQSRFSDLLRQMTLHHVTCKQENKPNEAMLWKKWLKIRTRRILKQQRYRFKHKTQRQEKSTSLSHEKFGHVRFEGVSAIWLRWTGSKFRTDRAARVIRNVKRVSFTSIKSKFDVWWTGSL